MKTLLLLYTLVTVLAVQSDKTNRNGMRGYREAPSNSRQLNNNPYYVYPEGGGTDNGDDGFTNSYYYPEVEDTGEQRESDIVSPVNDFVPLSCNDSMNPCVDWSTRYGSLGATISEPVIIPCGDCVRMDFSSSDNVLTLDEGIDIQGRLEFPDGYSLTLRTSAITVQGELEILSTGRINGNPLITIEMIGQDTNRAFTPVHDNVGACDGLEMGGVCPTGMKAISVAGGTVNLRGCPSDVPAWKRLYDVAGATATTATGVVLEDTDGRLAETWGVGADILITSHTRSWDRQQVRQISGVSRSADGRRTTLTLNQEIDRPTTVLEASDYAVEVALLSRNIVFRGGESSDDGGHFWIMYTPNVAQTIEGVDIQHFGQQGTLGRYPIHFHFCKSVQGSQVRKNTIRLSHQRCVVAHGSDDLVISENVAYDTAGHCYMTEDGIETGIRFTRNLGAKTRIPEIVIDSPGKETDDEPATFWISNPSNYFEENVGAGSENSAFWFELRSRGSRRGFFPNPIHMPLGSFDRNIAHSNAGATGAVRMYPDGYLPTVSERVVFTGLKLFRNERSAIFIHKVNNFEVTDSLFADNIVGIDVDRAEDIEVTSSTVIGKTASYDSLMGRDDAVGEICRNRQMVGIDLHTWRRRDVEEGSVVVRNVDFIGFEDIDCRSRDVIHFDAHTLKQGVFEAFVSFQDVSFPGPEFISFCTADEANEPIHSVYIVDQDGSLAPSSSQPSGASTLVSNRQTMLAFVDASKCILFSEGCFQYCEDICFQSVRYEVDPSGTENYQLKVCERGNPTNCIFMSGSLRDDGRYSDEPRNFLAHLPPGEYDAVFLDGNGDETWPSYVRQQEEEKLCQASIDVRVIVPPVADCSNTIRNGDAEASRIPDGWLTLRGGLQVLPGGSDGNFFSAIKTGGATLIQQLDTRCMTEGASYTIGADVRLTANDGTAVLCEDARCPTIGVYTERSQFIHVATVGGVAKPNGYQTVSGTFSVSSDTAASDMAFFFVEFNARRNDNYFLQIDNVAMVNNAPPSPSPTTPPTPNPTRSPTKSPTKSPTMPPTQRPTLPPTEPMTPSPASSETKTTTQPTLEPTPNPLPQPTLEPTSNPTQSPTERPTPLPSASVSVGIETNGACSNIIANSDMEQGVDRHWEMISGGFLSSLSTTSGHNSDTALSFYSPSIITYSGVRYKDESNMDYSCLKPSTKWEVSAMIQLKALLFGFGASCMWGFLCPYVEVTVKDGNNRNVASQTIVNYDGGYKLFGFNKLQGTMEFPSDWDGSVGDVSITVNSLSLLNSLVVDDFEIRQLT